MSTATATIPNARPQAVIPPNAAWYLRDGDMGYSSSDSLYEEE